MVDKPYFARFNHAGNKKRCRRSQIDLCGISYCEDSYFFFAYQAGSLILPVPFGLAGCTDHGLVHPHDVQKDRKEGLVHLLHL